MAGRLHEDGTAWHGTFAMDWRQCDRKGATMLLVWRCCRAQSINSFANSNTVHRTVKIHQLKYKFRYRTGFLTATRLISCFNGEKLVPIVIILCSYFNKK